MTSNLDTDRDRFVGECADPPVWDWCDFCGLPIYLGMKYWLHRELKICDDCEKKYASAVFEEEAKRMNTV